MKILKVNKNTYDYLMNQVLKGNDLDNAYARPSKYKYKAYQDCLDLVLKYDANQWGIISHNKMTFTFGFVANDKLYKITKDNMYEVIAR